MGVRAGPSTWLRDEGLASRDEPMSAIAFAHGFQSQSHFPRAFRQKYGCSPNQLRKAGLS
ncbi:helix-turn-helix domain-containing protein [Hoeflea alexandrii]|uniref:helix-turn-helix domain-containing protein n=1 Tax=Hoeflea alexandrii TaxID=288436 RepID=UPI0022AFAB4D|nr:helix-turn-helix domain-containing protein [Hoeflea alexandrii]MCZ4288061.1 helix-turn-helix domain-containing protein [Hoeflea alexandrii]